MSFSVLKAFRHVNGHHQISIPNHNGILFFVSSKRRYEGASFSHPITLSFCLHFFYPALGICMKIEEGHPFFQPSPTPYFSLFSYKTYRIWVLNSHTLHTQSHWYPSSHSSHSRSFVPILASGFSPFAFRKINHNYLMVISRWSSALSENINYFILDFTLTATSHKTSQLTKRFW